MSCVRDIMHKEVITAKPTEQIQRVSKILTEKRVSNIPIINEKGWLIGIVSEKDITQAMESEDFMKKTARDIMTKNVFSVKENDSVEYVSKIFVEQPYRRLPVTRGKRLVGSVTREDVIQGFMSEYY